MKNPIRIFWVHPQLREYRKPFFSLMNAEYSITFFFQQSSDIGHDFNAFVSRRNRIGGFSPWTMSWMDIRRLSEQIRRSDIVISSFVRNCYTYVSLLIARQYRKPVIVWDEWMRLSHAKFRYALRDGICRRLLPLIKCIYTLGPRQESLFRHMGYPRERIFRANEYPGYVFSSVEPSPCELNVAEDNRIVLYIGRLVQVKGVDYLIRAFPTVVDGANKAVLVIVGEGPEESMLKALADRLCGGNVRFLGSITDVRKRAFLYQRARVVVIPSVETQNKSDPGPLVTLEALSAGAPVVISDAVGNSHHIRNGVSGYVVPRENPSELANAICRCLSGEIGSRNEILAEFARIPGFEFQKQKMDEAIAMALSR